MNSGNIDTWASRDLPVLRAICLLADANGGGVTRVEQLTEATGLDRETVGRAVMALRGEDPPFFTASAGFGGVFGTITKVTGHARRSVGQWPSPESLADRITEALTQAADRTDDEEQRSWLRKTAAWFGSAGRDLLVDVTGAVVARQMD